MTAPTASANGSTSAGTNMNGIDAGTPPQWLLDAIAKAVSSAHTNQSVVPDQDAGAAPVL